MTIQEAAPAIVPEDLAKDTFARHGIPVPHTVLCQHLDQVHAYLRSHRAGSYVLKLSLDRLLHKSAVGGVRLDVPAEDVVDAYTELELLGRDLDGTYGEFRGVLIEPFAGRGIEVAIGFQLDPGLGPVVMIGDGGTNIEDTRRVVFAPAPVDSAGADQLVRRWTELPQSAGVGLDAGDRSKLAELVVGVAGAQGVAFTEHCASIDVNPVLVTADDVVAVDGVIETTSPDVLTQWRERLQPRQAHGDLGAFLEPGSLALIGATSDPTKPAYSLLRNLIEFGYPGPIYPVHPTADTIAGLTAYPSVLDIPGPVDKAVVLVGRDRVPAVIRQCVSKHVAAVQVYSSGFSEYAESDDIEQEILDSLAGSSTRVVGPNCWGAYSPRGRITTNAPRYAGTTPGNVAFISQSGTHFVDVVRRANLRSLPLYGAVSVGNCLDVKVDELAAHLLAQDDVHVLGLYLEGTARARDLIEVVLAAGKPVVVMRGGRTAQGSRAATSHTAALAGDDSVWSSLMQDAGVILVDTIEDMMDTLSGLATLPEIPGTRLSVFGTGGGVAVTAADVAARHGIELTQFDPQLSQTLAKRFGQPGTSMSNPMDVTVWNMFPDGRSALSEVLSLIAVPEVADSAIAYLELGSILDLNTPEHAEHLVRTLVTDLQQNPPQVPLSFVLRTGGDPQSETLLRAVEADLRQVGITVFSRIQDAVTTHARLARHGS